jgi:hypothetical protein
MDSDAPMPRWVYVVASVIAGGIALGVTGVVVWGIIRLVLRYT